MEIREILELEANVTSIKKIDEFLSVKNPNHRDYPKALAHLSYLTFSLGDIKGAFQLLFNYLEICNDKEKPVIYNTLIKIYYSQKKYNDVLKMIEAKKEYLPNYNKAAYYEDLITYYDTLDNSDELIRVSLIYLEDDISDERRLKALVRLCKEYFVREDYDHFNQKNKLIQTLALSLHEEEIYQNSLYEEAFVLVKEASYPKALALIDEMLETNPKVNLKGRLLALKLEILVSLGEYRRASIFEAEYEMIVMESSVDAKINFAKQCIILYEALNNRFNKTSYEERYQELLKEQESLEVLVEKPKKTKTTKQTIELNFLKTQKDQKPVIINEKKPEEKVEKVVTKIKREAVTMIEASTDINNIAEVFMKLNRQVYSQFRDYLRQFFILLCSIATFDEAYLLTKNPKYNGYHYKKERLYDKRQPNLVVNNTVLLDVMDINDEIIIPNTSMSSYNDIVTNKPYSELEDMALIALPLTNGSILFMAKGQNILTDKLNYEILKLATAYLETKWNSEQNELQLLKQHHDYTFMLEHIVMGYKKQIDNYIYLSEQVKKMFNLKEAISIEEFYNCITVKDLFEYKKTIKDLLSGNFNEATVRFSSSASGQLRYYEENFKVDEEGVILSVINDITSKVKEEENATLMAHYDPVSGVYNKSKLVYDIKDLIETNKFSLLVFNAIGFKDYAYIYGYEFADQLIFAIGKYLKEYDSDFRVYHFDGDKFILAIVNQNDKRAMIKKGKEIRKYLSNKLKNLNYRLNVLFEVGILRYPTDTLDQEPLKLIDYLMSALSNAHRNIDGIGCYSKEEQKKQFFQSQLVTHVSEAIDNNHLALYYQQVVDIGNQSCDHYYVSLNLTNFAAPQEMIYDILQRRNMTKTIERYIIHKSLFELSEMHKATKLYFNVSFKVSKETFVDPTFKDYLLEQLKFFSIPKSAITICYNDELTDKVYEVLKSLAINQILIATSNVEIFKQFPVYYFYYRLPKDIKYIENEYIISLKEHCLKRNIKFVLDNVNNKELIAHFAQHGISLYSGKIYSALLSSKDIIKSFTV